jgi:hypothetical protein
MAKPLLGYLWVYIGRQQMGGMGVAEVMETYQRQLMAPHEGPKCTGKRTRPNRLAVLSEANMMIYLGESVTLDFKVRCPELSTGFRQRGPSLACRPRTCEDEVSQSLLDTRLVMPPVHSAASKIFPSPRPSVLHGVAVMGKRLELLHELLPTAGVVALLVNPNSAVTQVETKALRESAHTLGVELRVLNVGSASEIATAFTTLAKEQSVPVVVSGDPLFMDQRVQLVVLAARYSVPAIYPFREFAAAGGLVSYGPDFLDTYRQAGIYAGRILKGSKPTDLPIQQAVKVDLVINLDTAKALGITFPITLLGRADEVIE